jgi:hypothetical protein
MKIKTLYTASVCSVLLLAGCDQQDSANQTNTAAPAQEASPQPSVAAPVIDTLKSAETQAQEAAGAISGAAETINTATQNAVDSTNQAVSTTVNAVENAATAATQGAVTTTENTAAQAVNAAESATATTGEAAKIASAITSHIAA